MLVAQTVARRDRPGAFGRPWATLAAQVAKEVVQQAQWNGAGTRAKRYAQCGLADMCAPDHMNYYIV